MKVLLKITIFLSVLFLLESCGSLKHKDITGSTKVKQVFSTKKYRDTEDVSYVIVSGEHGDEMEAKVLALANARLMFSNKATSLVNSAVIKEGSRELSNRAGTLNEKTKSAIISKAIQSYMYEVESELYYSEGRGTYTYWQVFKIDIDKIVSLLKDSN
jgi:hypothetical protein